MLFQTMLNALGLGAQRQRSRRNRRNADARRSELRRLFVEGLEDRRLLALAAPVAYETGSNPYAIVSADFNNDEVLDLATANYPDSTVSILLGNADGTFQTPALTAPTGTNPLSLAVGDLDGDGNLDVATANAYDVSILQGNGDGTFDPPQSLSVPYNPSSVAVGDFTGDGKLDLGVTSNYSYYLGYYYGYYYGYQGYASVLMGDGAGNFSGPNSTSLGTGYFGAATAANLDGVGAEEFLTTNSYYGYYYGAVAILELDGAGFLQVSDVLFTGKDAADVAVDDVNLDGAADIVTADAYYGSVSVLLADGLGGYGAAQTFAAGTYPFSVALGDITGDGNVDIVAADYYSGMNVYVLYGAANGAFSVPVPFPAGASNYSLAKGDFDGDGWLDIATANVATNTVSVLLNDQNWPAPPPSLSINDVQVTEGDAGTVAAVFTVTRSDNLDAAATVNYATANAGALAGSDYAAQSGVLTFAAGETTKTITILVTGDLTDEYDQAFVVNLSAPSGAVITDGQGVGTILDNDPEPTLTITPLFSKREGGNAKTTVFNFVVTVSAASEKEVRVSFATADGTATAADNDYNPTSGTLVFAPGVTSKSISVVVKGDKNKEADETFFVNLSGATNATIAASQGIGEILDDDARGGGKGGKGNSSAAAADAAISDWLYSSQKKRR